MTEKGHCERRGCCSVVSPYRLKLLSHGRQNTPIQKRRGSNVKFFQSIAVSSDRDPPNPCRLEIARDADEEESGEEESVGAPPGVQGRPQQRAHRQRGGDGAALPARHLDHRGGHEVALQAHPLRRHLRHHLVRLRPGLLPHRHGQRRPGAVVVQPHGVRGQRGDADGRLPLLPGVAGHHRLRVPLHLRGVPAGHRHPGGPARHHRPGRDLRHGGLPGQAGPAQETRRDHPLQPLGRGVPPRGPAVSDGARGQHEAEPADPVPADGEAAPGQRDGGRGEDAGAPDQPGLLYGILRGVSLPHPAAHVLPRAGREEPPGAAERRRLAHARLRAAGHAQRHAGVHGGHVPDAHVLRARGDPVGSAVQAAALR